MGKKQIRRLRVFTDASFHFSRRGRSRSSGGIVLVGQDGTIERAFLANYNNLDLSSCSAAEMFTMTLALEQFKGQAVSITGDSVGDVMRMEKFVTARKPFNKASRLMPEIIQERLQALHGQLGHVEFHQQPRENRYIRICDKLADRAQYAQPGVLHEVAVANGQISLQSLDKIAPIPGNGPNGAPMFKAA